MDRLSNVLLTPVSAYPVGDPSSQRQGEKKSVQFSGRFFHLKSHTGEGHKDGVEGEVSLFDPQKSSDERTVLKTPNPDLMPIKSSFRSFDSQLPEEVMSKISELRSRCNGWHEEYEKQTQTGVTVSVCKSIEFTVKRTKNDGYCIEPVYQLIVSSPTVNNQNVDDVDCKADKYFFIPDKGFTLYYFDVNGHEMSPPLQEVP